MDSSYLKYIADGAVTPQQAAELIERAAVHFEGLLRRGMNLTSPVEDGYAHYAPGAGARRRRAEPAISEPYEPGDEIWLKQLFDGINDMMELANALRLCSQALRDADERGLELERPVENGQMKLIDPETTARARRRVTEATVKAREQLAGRPVLLTVVTVAEDRTAPHVTAALVDDPAAAAVPQRVLSALRAELRSDDLIALTGGIPGVWLIASGWPVEPNDDDRSNADEPVVVSADELEAFS